MKEFWILILVSFWYFSSTCPLRLLESLLIYTYTYKKITDAGLRAYVSIGQKKSYFHALNLVESIQ